MQKKSQGNVFLIRIQPYSTNRSACNFFFWIEIWTTSDSLKLGFNILKVTTSSVIDFYHVSDSMTCLWVSSVWQAVCMCNTFSYIAKSLKVVRLPHLRSIKFVQYLKLQYLVYPVFLYIFVSLMSFLNSSSFCTLMLSTWTVSQTAPAGKQWLDKFFSSMSVLKVQIRNVQKLFRNLLWNFARWWFSSMVCDSKLSSSLLFLHSYWCV